MPCGERQDVGSIEGEALSLFHCSMALEGKGAVWLQRHGEAHNPYFGASMPNCGDRTRVLAKGL